MQAKPALFEEHAIRRTYDESTEIWWFSVVDIVRVLTQQPDYQTARIHYANRIHTDYPLLEITEMVSDLYVSSCCSVRPAKNSSSAFSIATTAC